MKCLEILKKQPTIIKQLRELEVLRYLEATGQRSSAIRPSSRHHRAPEIANSNTSTFSSKLIAESPASVCECLGILCATTFVNLTVRAMIVGQLILVHRRSCDQDNPRRMCYNSRVC